MVSMWEKIEILLREKQMTAYRLAKQAGVNYTLLAELKSGRKKDLKFSNACKIADALGVSLDELKKQEE